MGNNKLSFMNIFSYIYRFFNLKSRYTIFRRIVAVYVLPRIRVYLYMVYDDAFRSELSAWDPDFIHSNDWQTLWLGVEQKKTTNCFLVFDSHELEVHRNPPLPPAQARFMTNYEQLLLPQCDLVTTVGDAIAEHLQDAYSITKPAIIHNAPMSEINSGQLVDRWGRNPLDQTVRSELGLGDEAFIMMTVGNVTINRGIDTVVNALVDLPDHVVLAVLGKQNLSYRAELDELTNKLNLHERVLFVDPVNPLKVVPYISGADVGVIPTLPATLSYDYSLPNKLFECAFADLAIVASNTREVSRLVGQYNLGETFRPGDSVALAEIVQRLVSKKLAGKSIKSNNADFRDIFAFDHSLSKVISQHIPALIDPVQEK